MHQFCFYLDWMGIPSSELAAWVQAVGSVIAIIFAGYFPIWHGRIERGRQMDNYQALIVAAHDYARQDCLHMSRKTNEPSAVVDAEKWDRLIAAFDAIPFHELPHWSLLVPLDSTRADCKEFRLHLDQINRFMASRYPLPQREVVKLEAISLAMQGRCDAAAAARKQFGGRTPYERLRQFRIKVWRRSQFRWRIATQKWFGRP